MPSYAGGSPSRRVTHVQKGFTREYTDLSLHSACAKGDIGLATYALSQGQPVNSVMNCILPIHAAASAGNEGIIQLLIDHGADVNALRIPHKYANDRNKTVAGTSGTRLFTFSTGKSHSIPVHFAGSTPLHFAAANGRLGALALLLANGADPSLAEKHGFTPEMVAIQNGHAEAAELLHNSLAHLRASGSNSGFPATHPAVGRTPSQRSLDVLSRKHSGAPLARLSLHLPRPSSRDGPPSPIKSAPPTTLSFHPRRNSSTSSVSDTPSHRRPSLPAVFEKVAHPATALKDALATRRQGSIDSNDTESSPTTPHADQYSVASTSSVMNNTPRAQFTVNTSLANNFYRPRQMSQLSKGDDDDAGLPGGGVHSRESSGRSSSDSRTPDFESSGRESRTSPEMLPGSLQRQPIDPRRAAAPRDRADSTGSTNSSFSRWTAGSSLHHKTSLRNVYSSDVMQAGTTSQVVPSDTRTRRSNSSGTDGRFSSSPASSYSGPGTLSTCAPSNSTTGTSVRPPSPSAAQALARHPGLEPLYELASLQPKPHHRDSSIVTTSSEARSRRQRAERDLLAFNSLTPASATSARPSLTQQLAAYGESLSLERRLIEQEHGAGQSGYRWETIKKDGSREPTPITLGLRKDHPVLPSSLPSSVTPIAKSPIHLVDESSRSGTPHWRAIPSDDRLMPPPSSTSRRSHSPAIIVSSPSVPGSRKGSRDSDRSKDHPIPSMAPPDRTSSPAASTHNVPLLGSGTGGVSYVEVSPPSSSTARQHRHTRSGARPRSTKAHSARDSASSTTTRDQIEQDAIEAARLAAAIPKAEITVPLPETKKRLGGLRRLFGATKV